MDSLFNELYNIIIKEEDIKEDICHICHYKTVKDKVILKCTHVFHKKCLKCLKNCPYCNHAIKYSEIKKVNNNSNKCNILLLSGKNKGKECGRNNCGIHKNTVKQNICTIILKSGKNKGKECGRNNCGIHKNIIIL